MSCQRETVPQPGQVTPQGLLTICESVRCCRRDPEAWAQPAGSAAMSCRFKSGPRCLPGGNEWESSDMCHEGVQPAALALWLQRVSFQIRNLSIDS